MHRTNHPFIRVSPLWFTIVGVGQFLRISSIRRNHPTKPVSFTKSLTRLNPPMTWRCPTCSRPVDRHSVNIMNVFNLDIEILNTLTMMTSADTIMWPDPSGTHPSAMFKGSRRPPDQIQYDHADTWEINEIWTRPTWHGKLVEQTCCRVTQFAGAQPTSSSTGFKQFLVMCLSLRLP